MADELRDAREDDRKRDLPPREAQEAQPAGAAEPAESAETPDLPLDQDTQEGTVTWTPRRGLLAKTIAWLILAVLAVCLAGAVAVLLARAL